MYNPTNRKISSSVAIKESPLGFFFFFFFLYNKFQNIQITRQKIKNLQQKKIDIKRDTTPYPYIKFLKVGVNKKNKS